MNARDVLRIGADGVQRMSTSDTDTPRQKEKKRKKEQEEIPWSQKQAGEQRHWQGVSRGRDKQIDSAADKESRVEKTGSSVVRCREAKPHAASSRLVSIDQVSLDDLRRKRQQEPTRVCTKLTRWLINPQRVRNAAINDRRGLCVVIATGELSERELKR